MKQWRVYPRTMGHDGKTLLYNRTCCFITKSFRNRISNVRKKLAWNFSDCHFVIFLDPTKLIASVDFVVRPEK